MVSVREAHNVWLEGEPETEFSWFPGYAWTPATCMNCGQHLGWKFTVVGNSLDPTAFWGIASRSVEGGNKMGEPMQPAWEEGDVDDSNMVL